MNVPVHSPAARTVFRGLRIRLTAVFVVVGLLAFSAFVLILTVRDAEQNSRWTDTLLRGEASRAAALIYVDADGQVTANALRDDQVSTQASGLLVVQGEGEGADPTEIFASGRRIEGDWRSLAAACRADAPEQGTFADIGEVRVAGMPWWRETGDPQPAGCAMAATPRERLLDSRVLVPAAVGSALVLLLLTGIVWWTAGRSLRVAESALEDREQFLATAAHEMRGPLARIRTAAESAARCLPPGSNEAAGHLRGLMATADSAGRVASNLLLASRIDHAEVPVQGVPVRLDELAFDVETVIDGVVVDVTEPVTVTGDPMLLRQAMFNLADNAVRHGRTPDTRAVVLLTVAQCGEGAVVRVADDGPGFPPGLEVTRPYVSGSTGGNGLGLPLVQWIARRHGASLWTGSAGGEADLHGAAVEIRFPARVIAQPSSTMPDQDSGMTRP